MKLTSLLHKLYCWLPAYSLLSHTDEQQFRRQLIAEHRAQSLRYIVLALAVLMAFIVSNQVAGAPWHNAADVLRGACIALITLTMLCTRTLSDAHWLRAWFACCGLLMALLVGVFVATAERWGYLNEGGPIVAMLIFGSITVLHLGQKLLLWAILVLGLVLMAKLGSPISGWTFFYMVLCWVLMAYVQYQIDVLQRQHYIAEQAERIKAETDKLTGTLNRHAFEARLTQLIDDLKPQQALTVGMLDIDYFKRYNDHYGHLQGDQALIAVARCLKQLPLDLLVRFGGEEFIVVKVHNGPIPRELTQLHEQIAALQWPHAQSPFQHLSASVGLASYVCKERGEPLPANLLGGADSALYAAKEQGRNRTIARDIAASTAATA
ncbi:GGDEF domain-containing protein [Atopomonas sediminilitoris]|uniref:GGDEF domain-containing protein n=1 Tax=Atopomonas sediminilitoris TaxID=2919919 RepID=UPI001F4D4B03|nr:GGDEF domain-containing protein [Atopomonas sediminilitoris]MCJ8169598.1 GGDEF domain-containing protein [Atopomonas sediminilitoris]